jgi:hypothetical protein
MNNALPEDVIVSSRVMGRSVPDASAGKITRRSVEYNLTERLTGNELSDLSWL